MLKYRVGESPLLCVFCDLVEIDVHGDFWCHFCVLLFAREIDPCARASANEGCERRRQNLAQKWTTWKHRCFLFVICARVINSRTKLGPRVSHFASSDPRFSSIAIGDVIGDHELTYGRMYLEGKRSLI